MKIRIIVLLIAVLSTCAHAETYVNGKRVDEFEITDYGGMGEPPVSSSGSGRIYFDSISNTFKHSDNGGAYSDFASDLSGLGDDNTIGLDNGGTYTNFGAAGDDTLNELYAAIDTAIGGLAGGHDAVTVTDSTTIDLTLVGQDIEADLIEAGAEGILDVQDLQADAGDGELTLYSTGNIDDAADGNGLLLYRVATEGTTISEWYVDKDKTVILNGAGDSGIVIKSGLGYVQLRTGTGGAMYLDGGGTLSIRDVDNVGYPGAGTSITMDFATGNFDTIGTLQAGSGNITLTNATGNLDGEVIADNTIDDDSIDWGSGADQVDLADIPGGVAPASAFDFGAVSSIEVKNGTADVALANCGEIYLNETDEQLCLHSGSNGEISGEVALSLIYHISAVFDPDAVCDSDVNRLPLFIVGDDFPEGLIIDEWHLSFEADPTTEFGAGETLLKYADAQIGVANTQTIDDLATSAGVASEDTDANINSGNAIPNGKFIYVDFPTAYTETGHICCLNIWFHAEED